MLPTLLRSARRCFCPVLLLGLALFCGLTSAVAADFPDGMDQLLCLQRTSAGFAVQSPEMLKAFGFANVKTGDAVAVQTLSNGKQRVRVLGTGEEKDIDLGATPAVGQTIKTPGGTVTTTAAGSQVRQGDTTVRTTAQGTEVKAGGSVVRTNADGTFVESEGATVQTAHEGGTVRVRTQGAAVETTPEGTHVQTGDTEIHTSEEGSVIRSGDTEIKTGPNGVSISVPGVNINTEGGMNLDMNELIPNMNVGDDEE